MKYVPFNHQKAGLKWLIEHPRCALFADPGLGKTSTALGLVDYLMMIDSNALPALVIGPPQVIRRVWSDEVKRWDCFADIRVRNLVGTPDDRRAALRARAEVYTVSYNNLPWLCELLGDAWPYRTVIADEASRLKNYRGRNGGKRAASLAKMVKHTVRWVNLTGTPAPKGAIDLWGQTWFLDGGARLGRTFTEFTNRWFFQSPYEHGYTALNDKVLDEVGDAIKDICLTIDAKKELDLPPIIENRIYVDLPEKARAIYRSLARQMYATLAGKIVNATTAAHATQMCMQAAGGALYEDGRGTPYLEVHGEKIERLRDLHEEMNCAPLLVVYWFQHEAERLMREFPYARVRRNPADDDLWNEGKIPMMLIHPLAAGHGLNLQYGGSTIAFYTTWWGAEEYAQVIERLGPARQKQAGTGRRVIVHKLLARDTVDEDVQYRLETNISIQDAIRRRVTNL